MVLGDYDLVEDGFGSLWVAIIWLWVVLGGCASFWVVLDGSILAQKEALKTMGHSTSHRIKQYMSIIIWSTLAHKIFALQKFGTEQYRDSTLVLQWLLLGGRI